MPFDVVIADLIMPNKGGITTIMEKRWKYPSLKILAISGGRPLKKFRDLGSTKFVGANWMLRKSLSDDELLDSVNTCLSIAE